MQVTRYKVIIEGVSLKFHSYEGASKMACEHGVPVTFIYSDGRELTQI